MERNEIRILENLFDSIDSGLKIVIVEGEEGTGKTELLKYFCQKITNEAICSYFDIKETEENFISNITDNFLKNVKKVFETGRFSIIESIGRNVSENERLIFTVTLISSIKRTVLMFDNVERAPPSLFNTIMYIAKNHVDKKLMIILTINPLKKSENINEFLVRAEEIPETILKKIKLEPLTHDEVLYLIKDLGLQLPNYVIDKIFSASRGNFKKIMEILEYFKINDLIDKEGYWSGTFEDIPIIESQSIKSFFYSIYDNLNDQEKRFLTAISVIGKEFSLDEIMAIENLNENEIYNMLDKMIMLGIIEETENGKFKFRKDEFFDLLYNNEISNLRKRYLHRKLAEYYERKNMDPYKIGINYYKANEIEMARKYLEIAALNAYKEHNYKDAIEIFKKILDTIDNQYYIIIGECYFRLGDFKNARLFYEKALTVDRKNAIIRIAELEYTIGNLSDAERFLLDLEKEQLNKEQLFYLNYIRGAINERKFNFTDALKYYEIASVLATELNNDSYLALIYKQLGIIKYYKGEFEDSEKMSKKSLDYYSKISDFDGMARVYNNLALIETTRDFNKTRNYYELALSYANLSGNIYLLIVLNYNMALINFWNSNIKEAEQNVKIAKNLSEIINEYEIRHSILLFLSDIEKTRGNFSEALNYIDRAISFAEKIDSKFLFSFYNLKKFEILSIIGKTISIDIVDKMINDMKNLNPDLYAPYALSQKGKILIYRGEVKEGINYLLLAEKSKDILTFIDYIDFLGEIPFAYILNKDYENFEKSVQILEDLSKKINGNVIQLKAYFPALKGKECFEENEKFLLNNGLKFLLLKMYITYYEMKKEEYLKNKLIDLSREISAKTENFYKIDL